MSDEFKLLICKIRKNNFLKKETTERKQEFYPLPFTVGNEQLYHTTLFTLKAGFTSEIYLLLQFISWHELFPGFFGFCNSRFWSLFLYLTVALYIP